MLCELDVLAREYTFFVVCFPAEFVQTCTFGIGALLEACCELKPCAVYHAFSESLVPVIALLAGTFIRCTWYPLNGVIDELALDKADRCLQNPRELIHTGTILQGIGRKPNIISQHRTIHMTHFPHRIPHIMLHTRTLIISPREQPCIVQYILTSNHTLIIG